jgi:hypothetical protein
MKIVILGDTHFGARGDSLDFHKHFENQTSHLFFDKYDSHISLEY